METANSKKRKLGEDQKTKMDLAIGFATSKYFAKQNEERAYRSGVWDTFDFIYHIQNGTVVKHWYRCKVDGCDDPFEFCVVADGNSVLRRHKRRHHKESPIAIPLHVFHKALMWASYLGDRHGLVSSEMFAKYINPTTQENWIDNFIEMDKNLNSSSNTNDNNNGNGNGNDIGKSNGKRSAIGWIEPNTKRIKEEKDFESSIASLQI